MSRLGARGIEDIPFYPLNSAPAGLSTWSGNSGGIDAMFSGIIPVLVMNRDTGIITERAMTESVYWSSISVVGTVANFFPIWDFEPEVPDVNAEQILLKISSAIIDVVASKLAPQAALLARALDRAAIANAGGVSTLAIIRGIWCEMGGVRFQVTNSGQKKGVGNGGGARIGWPIQGSSSFGFGINDGLVDANAKLTMGTNQVAGVYPFFDAFDGFARTYEGLFSGQFSAGDQDIHYSNWFSNVLCPIAMTPGEVLQISPALDPSGGAAIPAWPAPGSVSICWSEFAAN